MPSEGSSRRRSFGRAISARPSATICCSPPDSVAAAAGFARQEGKEGIDAVAVVVDAAAVRTSGGTQPQVLRHGQGTEQPAPFGRMGNAEPHDPRRRQSVDALAEEANLAGARAAKSRDRAQRGALAGAVGAKQGNDFARSRHAGLPRAAPRPRHS